MKRIHKQFRLMEDVERISVFEKTFLETYLEKVRRNARYSFIETDFIEPSQKAIRQLNQNKIATHDLQKHLEGTIRSMSDVLGFSQDV